jgi:hypothetical protein
VTNNSEQVSGRISSVTEISKSVLVLLSLGAAVIGGMAGFFTFAISYERERSAWDAIKAAHTFEAGHGQNQYGHGQLNEREVEAIKEALGIPDFSGFVRFDDELHFVTEKKDGDRYFLNVDLEAGEGNAMRYGTSYFAYFRTFASGEPPEMIRIIEAPLN